MTKEKGTYINFELPDEQNPRTQIWNVLTKDDDFLLGKIKWFGKWRKYCFFPTENTVYANICLLEISQFIEKLMAERKG